MSRASARYIDGDADREKDVEEALPFIPMVQLMSLLSFKSEERSRASARYIAGRVEEAFPFIPMVQEMSLLSF